MTKPAKKKRIERKEVEAVEAESDAWNRFTEATHKIALPRRLKPKKHETGESS